MARSLQIWDEAEYAKYIKNKHSAEELAFSTSEVKKLNIYCAEIAMELAIAEYLRSVGGIKITPALFMLYCPEKHFKF